MSGRKRWFDVVSGFSRTTPRLFALGLVALLASPYAVPDLDAAQQRGRALRAQPMPRNDVMKRQVQRRFEEPAYARGFSDGHARGLEDGRKQARYDPAGSDQYRNADQGFQESYGSRDAYRNNYRAGFRQGYEEGYRAGTR
jgi:hypothetical protein